MSRPAGCYEDFCLWYFSMSPVIFRVACLVYKCILGEHTSHCGSFVTRKTDLLYWPVHSELLVSR